VRYRYDRTGAGILLSPVVDAVRAAANLSGLPVFFDLDMRNPCSDVTADVAGASPLTGARTDAAGRFDFYGPDNYFKPLYVQTPTGAVFGLLTDELLSRLADLPADVAAVVAQLQVAAGATAAARAVVDAGLVPVVSGINTAAGAQWRLEHSPFGLRAGSSEYYDPTRGAIPEAERALMDFEEVDALHVRPKLRLLAAASAPPPVSNYDVNGVRLVAPTLSASGATVTVTAPVQTNRAVAFQFLQVALRGPAGENLDTGYAGGQTINGSTTLTGSRTATVSGTYRAYVAYQIVGSGAWVEGPDATVAVTVPVVDPGTPPPLPPVGSGVWLSGAASPYAANGTFGGWRGEPITMAGTWNNGGGTPGTSEYLSVAKAQHEQYTIQKTGTPLPEWRNWTGPMDNAIGAIEKRAGQSWAQAAAGAYDAQWADCLTEMKKAWEPRNTANLYIRFAHEMNGSWFPWNVQASEAAAFVTSWKRFRALQKQIMPLAKLVYCVNHNTSGISGLDVRRLWPGKEFADVYSVDLYNNYPHAVNASEWNAKQNKTGPYGEAEGLFKHREQALAYGVPFAVPEWSNDGDASASNPGGGGEAPYYVQAFNAWCRQYAGSGPGQLLYEIHFNLWPKYLFYPVEQSMQRQTAAAYAALKWGS